MGELAIGVASAFWLGIQTAIAPCPMATNVAAISFIGRRVGSSRQVLAAGLLYTLGRALAYLALGVLLVGSVLSKSWLSMRLQEVMHMLLGPILIVVAMFMLDLIQFSFSGPGVSEKMQKRIEAAGIWAALFLGILFAVSFCPFSAALFFLGLIPVAIECNSPIVLPATYGVATALPVFAFAFLIAFSAQSVGKAFNVLTQVEWWARRIAGVIFLVVGIFFSLVYCFGITWLDRFNPANL
jgi:sulfite exporter TauE/SafE